MSVPLVTQINKIMQIETFHAVGNTQKLLSAGFVAKSKSTGAKIVHYNNNLLLDCSLTKSDFQRGPNCRL